MTKPDTSIRRREKLKDYAKQIGTCPRADCAYCRRAAKELLKLLPEFIKAQKEVES